MYAMRNAVLLMSFVLAALSGSNAALAQSATDSQSDSSYLSSLDDMVLDMDLGSIATETYDTIVVTAPQLSQANAPHIADMDCGTLEKWVAQNTDANGVLAGVEWAGDEYQAALTACAFPATHALALATPGPSAGS
jgi:hypothetical protein